MRCSAEVPLCSHSMQDAERFKTTNNMYSIFSVPDHQNSQAMLRKLVYGSYLI